MLDEHVEFLEGAGVEQELDALARRQLALGVLGRHAPPAAARRRLDPPPIQIDQNMSHAKLSVEEAKVRRIPFERPMGPIGIALQRFSR